MHGKSPPRGRELIRPDTASGPTSVDSQTAAEAASEKHESRKPMLPSFLVSTVVHLALLLILCLVVTGGDTPLGAIEFLVEESQPMQVAELATFDLEPNLEPVIEEPLEIAEQDFKLDVDLSPMETPQPEEEPAEVVSAAAEPVSVQATTPVSTTLAQPMARAAMSIQKRVSEGFRARR